MFAAGTRLPDLTTLNVTTLNVLDMLRFGGGRDFEVSAEDAECLAHSCSALQQLSVRLLQSEANDAQHVALCQLTSLTRLCVTNVTDETLGEVLGHMTQVKRAALSCQV
jgi:hypothetical protein